MMGPRLIGFTLVICACIALSVAYGWHSISRSRALVADRTLPPLTVAGSDERTPAEDRPVADPLTAAHTSDARPPTTVEAASSAATPPSLADSLPPTLLLRHTGLDRSYGVLAADAAGGLEGQRRATPLRCDRLHFSIDRGVCLTTDRLYTTQSLIVFDAEFTERFRLHLSGLPSRARVSPDGRLAAATVFVTGHSYADGAFSTETTIIDTHSGDTVIANLQRLPVFLDGQRLNAIDFNVWGVTFMPDNDGFYATLATGGHTYLVRGAVSAGQLRILRDGVECPSVSPDGTRVAFKRRVTAVGGTWRLHVMDTSTLVDAPVAELRSVDDQVEWLDNRPAERGRAAGGHRPVVCAR
jgi:hypothetical protein